MENVVFLIVGVLLIVIGIVHRKGNISLLHSYHRKRVAKEDILPFGKLVGLGLIIAGASLIVSGVLFFLFTALQGVVYYILANVALIGGMVVGIGVSIFAIIKYNKGLF